MGKREKYILIKTVARLKVGKNIQLNELMKLNEYQRSLRFQIGTFFFFLLLFWFFVFCLFVFFFLRNC